MKATGFNPESLFVVKLYRTDDTEPLNPLSIYFYEYNVYANLRKLVNTFRTYISNEKD